jgi:MinD-like ATPase involved in chromosome partitioning or flagellar assembly
MPPALRKEQVAGVTQIVTFYSFKGGVGRTMALVNTAHALARRGARVLMVDFDLEAPGMSHFFSKSVRTRSKRASRDALDLLLEAKSTLKEIESGVEELEPPLSLDDYIVHVKVPPNGSAVVSRYLEGRIDLLPATLDRRSQGSDPDGKPSSDYLDRIEELDLAWIFSPAGPGHRFGAHVGDYFRHARFRARGDILFALRDPVFGAYDFVLIDSRTGLNEISGLCVGPLCDYLVICTSLNEQNVAGTGYFLKEAGLLDKTKGKPYLLVIGPVPPWRSDETSHRIAGICKALASEQFVEVPYHPSAALEERIFVLDRPMEAIGEAFEDLALKLEVYRDGSLAVLRETLARKRWPADDRPDPERLSTWKSVAYRAPAFFRSSVDEKVLPSLGLPPFPTLFESIVIPRKGIRWGEVDLVALGAAVAMYRHQSKALMVRNVSLLDLCEGREAREALLTRIALFVRRLFGVDGEALLTRALTPADRSRLTEIVHGERPGERRERRKTGPTALRLSYGKDISERDLADLPYLPGSRLIELYDHAKLGAGLLLKIHYSDSDIDLADLNLQAELLDSFWKSRLWVPEELRSYPPREELPGFSLALAFASLIAASSGREAVDAVLRWIEIGRVSYGYAWRVIINWRRLDSVKDTDVFRKFIEEENAAVEEVESKFDLGIWSL